MGTAKTTEGGRCLEDTFFGAVAGASLAAAAITPLVAHHLHGTNARVQYALDHLPAALLGLTIFAVAVALARRVLLARSASLETSPAVVCIALLSVVFCACWLPVMLASGFVQDDWMLLAAASIRKVIYVHPQWSWYALDTVDGNFRPLGTVLYVGYMVRWFGLAPMPYLTGLFAVNLAGCLVAFLLVREMGYTKVAASAGALLYMSRGMIYTIVSWTCALGDGLAILFCGLMALALVNAVKRPGRAGVAWHLAAWGCFFVATLAKQSAFAAPLIVALVLFLRPGVAEIETRRRRLLAAATGLVIYGATAAVIFLHGKALLAGPSPYPVAFSWMALLRTFLYATYFIGPVDIPDRYTTLALLPEILGVLLVAGAAVLLWRVPSLLGGRPRDVVFALLAAVASISLFAVLGSRVAPYYGSMAAFWLSIALGILLTRFHPAEGAGRLCGFIFCALLVGGFADIRIKQTALIPSGGYTWGTFGTDGQRRVFDQMQQALREHPEARVLVLDDMPGYASWYTGMALLADPQLETILAYDSVTQAYLTNDLGGARPGDTRDVLNDPRQYNFTQPVPKAEAAKTLRQGAVLRLGFHGGNIVPEDSRLSAAW